MLQTLLIDNEPMALVNLRHNLSPFADFNVVAACTVPEEALDLCARQPMDIAFIDIEMPRIKGLDLAQQLRKLRPDLLFVFVTAYQNHAVQAFESDALDYLLKPVTSERIALTVKKIHSRLPSTAIPSAASGHIPAKANGRIYLLETDEVLYLSVEGRNVTAVTADGFYRLQGNLTHWENALPANQFLRCHNAYIVNLKKVEYIAPLFKNAYSLKIAGHAATIPVSRNGAAKLREYTRQ